MVRFITWGPTPFPVMLAVKAMAKTHGYFLVTVTYYLLKIISLPSYQRITLQVLRLTAQR